MNPPDATGSTSLPPRTTIAPEAAEATVEVQLFENTIERSSAWALIGSIPYGDDPNSTVALTRGGREAEVVLWGPESVAAVNDTSWWVVDPGNQRVALFDSGKVVQDVGVDPSERLQFGSVTSNGGFVAHGASGWFVFDRESTIAESTQSVEDLLQPNIRLPAFVSEQGFARLTNRCSENPRAFRLEAARPDGVGDDVPLFSAVEAWCSTSSGEMAVLWYGYFAGSETQLVTFVLLGPSGEVEAVEPAGPILGEHDPGTPAMLGLLPRTGEPVLGLNGETGMEVWVRRS